MVNGDLRGLRLEKGEMGVDGGGMREKMVDCGEDDEREGEREEEDDGESEEVARVGVDDAFGFGEDGEERERWWW